MDSEIGLWPGSGEFNLSKFHSTLPKSFSTRSHPFAMLLTIRGPMRRESIEIEIQREKIPGRNSLVAKMSS